MEPRPQKPRQPAPQQQAPHLQQQPTQYIGPDPQQMRPPMGQPGHDAGAFIAPPRGEYDYSPLDLQPPSQRRKRQVIAGIIGALAVVAIGALIVAGWMAMRDNGGDDVTPEPNDRVAGLAASPTAPAEDDTADTDGEVATEAPQQTAAPTAPPTPTAPQATTYTNDSIGAVLPPVTSLPDGYADGGDTEATLEQTVGSLTCESDPTPMLTDLGWQAAKTRTFTSNDPATTGSTVVTVSAHAFKDAPSAEQAVTEYANILECFGWTKVDGEQLSSTTQYLTWTDPNTGESSVTAYFTDGQILYRVFASGPSGVDSTETVVAVARRILGQ